MKDVVILGAGVGSRLRPLTDNLPKLLVPVAEKTILDRALEVLVKSDQVNSVTIVVGYQSKLIAKHVEKLSPKIRLIYNHSYAQTNNMHSLYLALSTLNLQNDVVLMNGDCVYEPSVLQAAIDARSDMVFADSVYPLNDESMKIDVNANGAIQAIAKALQAEGTPVVSIDLYCLNAKSVAEFYEIIDGFQGRAIRDQWVEVALNTLLGKRSKTAEPFKHFDIAGKMWMEIDNFSDLEHANGRFKGI